MNFRKSYVSLSPEEYLNLFCDGISLSKNAGDLPRQISEDQWRLLHYHFCWSNLRPTSWYFFSGGFRYSTCDL